MYRDPAAADEMLDQLSELLRASHRTAQTDEVHLCVEPDLLERYLALMRARFGEGLHITMRVEAQEALVPSLFLQSLVENAIRHGNVRRIGKGGIDIHARKVDDHLVLEIKDDGPGTSIGQDIEKQEVGMSATAEPLKLLHENESSLEARTDLDGGFLVRARWPYKAAGLSNS